MYCLLWKIRYNPPNVNVLAMSFFGTTTCNPYISCRDDHLFEDSFFLQHLFWTLECCFVAFLTLPACVALAALCPPPHPLPASDYRFALLMHQLRLHSNYKEHRKWKHIFEYCRNPMGYGRMKGPRKNMKRRNGRKWYKLARASDQCGKPIKTRPKPGNHLQNRNHANSAKTPGIKERCKKCMKIAETTNKKKSRKHKNPSRGQKRLENSESLQTSPKVHHAPFCCLADSPYQYAIWKRFWGTRWIKPFQLTDPWVQCKVLWIFPWFVSANRCQSFCPLFEEFNNNFYFVFLIFCSRMSLQNLPHMFPLVSSVQTQCSRFRLESPSDVRRFLSLIAEPWRCWDDQIWSGTWNSVEHVPCCAMLCLWHWSVRTRANSLLVCLDDRWLKDWFIDLLDSPLAGNGQRIFKDGVQTPYSSNAMLRFSAPDPI